MTALAELARLPHAERRREIVRRGVETVRTDWALWRQPGQEAPAGPWQTWLMMAGRGFGKTRAGAEWVREIAERGNGRTAIALVAGTAGEARNVMIEGESGILAVSRAATRPAWEPTRGRLLWRSGAQAFVYSGENPEKLRGPQHRYAWCDELAKWAYPQATWDNLQLGLRHGELPQTLVTTTPRAVPLMRALVADPAVVVTRGTTHDNVFLPEGFVRGVTRDYGGTRLGRQELDGALIDDVAGALWTRAMLEAWVISPSRRRAMAPRSPGCSGQCACRGP